MKQEVYLADGAIHCLSDIMQQIAPLNVFLVRGKAAYTLSGAEAILVDILQPYSVDSFYEFEYNPKIEDVERGLELFRQRDYGLVIAVGGGSVLDMAKLIRIMAAQDVPPSEIVNRDGTITHRGIPLVAIPTTAGTGSEATHFAVVYIDKTKYSVAHEYILPDIAIIDPLLTHSMPPNLTAVTGMDALSQAIESYWSVNSTDESKAYAREAIVLTLQNLERSVHKPSPETRYAMCKAAHLAGRAINISKTTAPHAVSYTLTSHFGIPHGHAVGLTLGEFLVFNSEVSDADNGDPRGVEFVRSTIRELCEILGVKGADRARDEIYSLMERIGLETSLSELGIKKQGHDFIVNDVNLERLKNNPRCVTSVYLETLLREIS